MTRTHSFRRLLLAGSAVAALALSGCGADLQAQTSEQVPAVPGGNKTVQIQTSPVPTSVSVRDAMFVYDGAHGYKAGALAPLQVRIFNDTMAPVKVTIEGAEPATPIEIPAAGYAIVAPTGGTPAKVKLTSQLLPGFTVPVTFKFDNGAVITLDVPIASPTAPAPRTTGAASPGTGH